MLQFRSLPRLSTSGHLSLRPTRDRSLHVVNVQLPPSLDQALSAKRVNKPQLRALCELQQLQAELQQKQPEKELLRAEAALKGEQHYLETQLLRMDAMLKDRTSKLLFARGLLNATGVLEWLEEEYAPKYGISLHQKTEIWQAILADPINKDLETCLVRATGKQKQKNKQLHFDIRATYDRASNHVHSKKRDSAAVDIVEGALLTEQAQIMTCICEYFHFPYKFRIQEFRKT